MNYGTTMQVLPYVISNYRLKQISHTACILSTPFSSIIISTTIAISTITCTTNTTIAITTIRHFTVRIFISELHAIPPCQFPVRSNSLPDAMPDPLLPAKPVSPLPAKPDPLLPAKPLPPFPAKPDRHRYQQSLSCSFQHSAILHSQWSHFHC